MLKNDHMQTMTHFTDTEMSHPWLLRASFPVFVRCFKITDSDYTNKNP